MEFVIMIRISSPSYSIIDTTDLDCDKNTIIKKIEQEKNMILKEIEDLKKDKEKREKLRKDLEIEEKEKKEFLKNRRSNNRDSLGSVIGFGTCLLGFAICGGCKIF